MPSKAELNRDVLNARLRIIHEKSPKASQLLAGAKRVKTANTSASDNDPSYQNEESSTTDKDFATEDESDDSSSDIFSGEREELTMEDLALGSITT